MTALPEPWLRGPIPRIPSALQPAAHAFVAAREDVEAAVALLTPDQVWLSPGSIAPIGFHLAHLAGATDRLLTYARGDVLTEKQREALAIERTITSVRPPANQMLEDWRGVVESALEQLTGTAEATLQEIRLVGRAQLPSTVMGLLFHAAEHAARHTGQIVTTAKVVRSLTGKP